MASQQRSVRHAAMDLLARREHSRRELERKLRGRYDPDEIDEALAKLAAESLQCDARFALSFARERALRGIGPQRIQRELLQRGVSGSTADHALRTLEEREGINWQRVAREALQKKFGHPALPAEYDDRVRRLRFLQYRGFAGDELQGEDG
jgi:regulatory protein